MHFMTVEMSYPQQSARTRRFSLGVPRAFQIARDGSYVAYLRTQSGTDPVTCLWTISTGDGTERLIADPRNLSIDEGNLPSEERARRERAREQAGGITGYATDRAGALAAFALGGRLHTADLRSGEVTAQDTATPAFDPRPDPTGGRIAYIAGRTLRVVELPTGEDRALVQPESDQISYGLAEFIAAEEMGRMRGYWWAPDGQALLVARVDETPVERWHIADPANPDRPATEVAYPAAGTPNAYVGVVILRLDGQRTGVSWDRGEFPYLVTAYWDEKGPLIVVQPRDQRSLRVLRVDAWSGETTLERTDADPVWTEIVPGVPVRTGGGTLVRVVDDRTADTRRVVVGEEPVTPEGLQVRAVLDVEGDTILFTAAPEPTEQHLYSYAPDTGVTALTEGPGVYSGRRRGTVSVITGSRLDRPGVTTTVSVDSTPQPDDSTFAVSVRTFEIESRAETPVITPKVELIKAGEREIRTAVLLPHGWDPAQGKLPVLMDPYGGPHAQRVLAVQRIYCEAQWLADQGFAVVIADGRGTPSRGPAWERTVRGDFVTPVLEDQITALEAAARLHPDALDLDRVGIRGWSFGGWLAALAVLRRPDVFHAAVAGAPVTDWKLYDTHYTERYLGHPEEEPETYTANSLLADAAKLERPLLLIHGLADDNVVAAHTLRLSSALLAAGRPHQVLPLSGVTHMTPQEVVAENLLHIQIEFLRRSLTTGA
jgi:dipeptidyl-peptidase-4